MCYAGTIITTATCVVLQLERKYRAGNLFDPTMLYLVSHTYHDTWHGRFFG